jgi:hypothetical protein
MRRFLGRLLGSVLALGIVLTVAGLMSEINHRRYRLRGDQQLLRVERGLLLPVGFGPHHQAGSTAEADAYAPLPLPPGETYGQSPVFDDRTELDRALFNLLYAWAEPRLLGKSAAAARLAVRYVQRLESLPGLTEAQRLQLQQLRAEVAFVRASQLLSGLPDQLRAAQRDLQLTIRLNSPRAAEAKEKIEHIDRQLDLLRPLLPVEANKVPL